MNDGIDKKFNFGIGQFVTKLEIYAIKNLFILSKLVKRFSFLTFLKIKYFIQFLFSKEYRRSTITIIIITIITIKIIQLIKRLINKSKKRVLNKELTTNKEFSKEEIKDTSGCVEENTNKLEIIHNNLDTKFLSNSNNMEQNKIDKILKINKSLELQNKIREKNNLPKENLNSPFYNILKIYISNEIYKN